MYRSAHTYALLLCAVCACVRYQLSNGVRHVLVHTRVYVWKMQMVRSGWVCVCALVCVYVCVCALVCVCVYAWLEIVQWALLGGCCHSTSV